MFEVDGQAYNLWELLPSKAGVKVRGDENSISVESSLGNFEIIDSKLWHRNILPNGGAGPSNLVDSDLFQKLFNQEIRSSNKNIRREKLMPLLTTFYGKELSFADTFVRSFKSRNRGLKEDGSVDVNDLMKFAVESHAPAIANSIIRTFKAANLTEEDITDPAVLELYQGVLDVSQNPKPSTGVKVPDPPEPSTDNGTPTDDQTQDQGEIQDEKSGGLPPTDPNLFEKLPQSKEFLENDSESKPKGSPSPDPDSNSGEEKKKRGVRKLDPFGQIRKQAEIEAIQLQAEEAGKRLAQKPAVTSLVTRLTAFFKQYYAGCIWIRDICVTKNTRITSRVTDTVKPADRVWHPNCPDSFKAESKAITSGSNIEQKYSDAKYDVSIVESQPGTMLGVIADLPQGFDPQWFLSLASTLTQMNVETFLQNPPTQRELIPINKETLTTMLGILNLPARFVARSTNAPDLSKIEIRAEHHVDADQYYWLTLSGYDSTGKKRKITSSGYLPLTTFVTGTTRTVNLSILTKALFGGLLKVSEYLYVTKFSMLTADARSKFNTDSDNEFLYTGFTDIMSVPSFTSTRKEVKMVQMKLPMVQLSTTNSGKEKTVWQTASHTDPLYDRAKYKQIMDYPPTMFSSLSVRSRGSKITDKKAEAGYYQLLASVAEGNAVPTARRSSK
jgi:hypothetical protein